MQAHTETGISPAAAAAAAAAAASAAAAAAAAAASVLCGDELGVFTQLFVEALLAAHTVLAIQSHEVIESCECPAVDLHKCNCKKCYKYDPDDDV